MCPRLPLSMVVRRESHRPASEPGQAGGPHAAGRTSLHPRHRPARKGGRRRHGRACRRPWPGLPCHLPGEVGYPGSGTGTGATCQHLRVPSRTRHTGSGRDSGTSSRC